jgi:ATP-dependent helicase YprA (DUF1998 family)
MKELYPWQAAALESGEDGRNLVYCAPTSGGKTAVAEVLMIRRLLATSKPHIYLGKKVRSESISCRCPSAYVATAQKSTDLSSKISEMRFEECQSFFQSAITDSFTFKWRARWS